jgi:hypothetical protein
LIITPTERGRDAATVIGVAADSSSTESAASGFLWLRHR